MQVLTALAGDADDFHVLCRIVGFDVRVDRFLHHLVVQLGSS